LSAELEARVDQMKALEMDFKNIVYCEIDAREVLEYEYKKLSHVCIYHMELRDCEKLCRSSTKIVRSCEAS
jgi:hypothetical protein